MMSLSIYEYIKSHLVDDRLPEDFHLPQEKAEAGKIQFADGAMDGITMYHMAGATMSEEQRNKMKELVAAISDGDYAKADICLTAFAEQNRALSVIDDFENYIRQNSENLNAGNIYLYGIKLVSESDNRECVKYGLEILELFRLRDEVVKDFVRILGLCNEFTLFSIFLMMQWENRNEEIFRLAQSVTGWGRIHAIEKLEADTQEIKDWLLKEGIHNRILPEYSALTCFEKAQVQERLLKEPGQIAVEEVEAIGKILKAMLVEGPVPGISAVPDRKEVLANYLRHAKAQGMAGAEYEAIEEFYHKDKTGSEA